MMAFGPRPLSVMCLLLCLAAPALGARPMQFWNTTSGTIRHLWLAPAGTGQFGPDQCANDPDGAVDHDERLKLEGVTPGRYDVKLVDAKGRTCIIRGVELRGGKPYAFALSDDDLRSCG